MLCVTLNISISSFKTRLETLSYETVRNLCTDDTLQVLDSDSDWKPASHRGSGPPGSWAQQRVRRLLGGH